MDRFVRISPSRRVPSESGQGVVDYLMVTVVIAAIAIPILNNLFGDRIMGSLFNERQRLVDFIGQTPKRNHPVPNAWFSAEKQAKFDNQQDIAYNDLNDPELNDTKELDAPSDVGGKGEIKQPRSIGGQRELKPVGDVGGRGNVGGSGNVGGGGSQGGNGGFGNNNLGGDDFFNGGGGKGGAKNEGGQGSEGGGGNSFKRGGGGFGDEGTSPTTGGGGGETKKQQQQQQQGGGDDKNATLNAKRSEAEGVAKAMDDERRRQGEFDWWFLIKILIVFLILFLLVLIALSNLKKR